VSERTGSLAKRLPVLFIFSRSATNGSMIKERHNVEYILSMTLDNHWATNYNSLNIRAINKIWIWSEGG
jgi:hypothetical protein